jgi:DNA-binding NtrC family response regulator
MSVIAERPVSALTSAGAFFSALGRTLLCLDAAFTIKYCSSALAHPGQPATEILGEDLFGPLGTLRQLLEQGEWREGWRVILRNGEPVSVAAVPCAVDDVRYLVVLRPAEADLFLGSSAPSFFFGAVAASPAMLDIVTLLDAVAGSDAPVMFTGEEGTGKKTLARALHAASPRRAGRFVPLDCAVVSAELLSLDVARGGTLFLNHVDRLPFTLQAKLLGVVEQGTHVIAASKTDVRRAIDAGAFREDLARALRTIAIDVPPLRARIEDVQPLALHLLARVSARHGRAFRIAPDAVRVLLRHTWPGNVRELESAIEHGAVVTKTSTIEPGDLPPEVLRSFDDPRFRGADQGELQLIRSALDTHHWNREATARSLGMSRTTLWRKMRELRLV